MRNLSKKGSISPSTSRPARRKSEGSRFSRTRRRRGNCTFRKIGTRRSGGSNSTRCSSRSRQQAQMIPQPRREQTWVEESDRKRKPRGAGRGRR
eukprot:13860578-Heterocapsa_arctica.AAC.1